jgi:hypothetical protein
MEVTLEDGVFLKSNEALVVIKIRRLDHEEA